MAEPWRWLCVAGLLLGSGALVAQDANNVLGLPAVPQGPPKAVASAAKGTAKPNVQDTAAPAKPTDADIKSILAGNVKLASLYHDGLITVRVSTDATFTGKALRAQAVQAARLVQRDARAACDKLCKPAPMPAPALQPDNTLSFDIVVSGYEGVMSTPDMINLVSGKRVGPPAPP